MRRHLICWRLRAGFEAATPDAGIARETESAAGGDRVFCAHEYTLANLHFATLVEPENVDLQEFLVVCEQQRALDQPTVPSRIGAELRYNPFLRWDSPSIRQTLKNQGRLSEDTPDGVFAAVREWKNTA